jgi:protein involved in polysaccharide export with SLBB domain
LSSERKTIELKVVFNKRGQIAMIEPSPLPTTIQPLDVLAIDMWPARPPLNIRFGARCLVEPDGNVLLAAVGRVNFKGLSLEQAVVKLTKQLKGERPWTGQVKFAERLIPWREAIVPRPPYTIKPGDVLAVDLGPMPAGEGRHRSPASLGGNYRVEDEGTINFGPAYGRVRVNGLTLEAAEAAVRERLSRFFDKPIVQVTLPVCRRPEPDCLRDTARPKAPYTIKPGDLLHFVVGYSNGQPPPALTVPDNLAVEPGGTLALGAALGRVKVEGMSLEDAQKAIERRLQEVSQGAVVYVTPAGWMDFSGAPGPLPQQSTPPSRERIEPLGERKLGAAPETSLDSSALPQSQNPARAVPTASH